MPSAGVPLIYALAVGSMNSKEIFRSELSPSLASWLPTTKGLIDALEVPSPFPEKLIPASVHLPDSRGYMCGRWTIAFNLIRLGFKLQFNQRFRPASLPQSVRDLGGLITHLQGFWLDFAHLLAQTDGFLNSALRQQLQDQCQPTGDLSFDVLKSTIDEDLGSSIDKLFSRFDRTPIYKGIHANTYRARLRLEGIEIEIKVRRPELEKYLKRDIEILSILSKILHFFHIKKASTVDEFIVICRDRLPSLLDLRYEASAMRRMKRSLKDHKFYVAKLFRNYVGKHILIKEHVEAPTLQQFLDVRVHDPQIAESWLQTNGIDLQKVARRLYHSMFRQICEDNFFNQNLITSNILLLKNSRLAVLSCDETGSVDKRFLTIFNLAMTTINRDAYEKFADTLFLLCESLPVNDLSAVRADVIRTVRTHAARSVLESASHYEKSILKLANDISNIFDSSGIVLDRQMKKLMLALGNIDVGVYKCNPKMNHRSEMARYAKKAASRRMRHVISGGFGKAVVSAVTPLSEMVRFETAAMRQKAQTFRATSSKLSYLGTTIVKWLGRVLLAVSILGVWIYMLQHHYQTMVDISGTRPPEFVMDLTWLPNSWWILIFILIFVVYRVVHKIELRVSTEETPLRKGAV